MKLYKYENHHIAKDEYGRDFLILSDESASEWLMNFAVDPRIEDHDHPEHDERMEQFERGLKTIPIRWADTILVHEDGSEGCQYVEACIAWDDILDLLARLKIKVIIYGEHRRLVLKRK